MPGVPIGFSTTFLAIRQVEDRNTTCNGVVYPVTEDELDRTDQREGSYQRVRLPLENIEWLASSASNVDAHNVAAGSSIWAYVLPVSTELHEPTSTFPIVQSYLDICLTGCLDIQGEFAGEATSNFALEFLRTTAGWNPCWVNDRIHPRRPFAAVPQAISIDLLLHQEFGELFDSIQLDR